MTGRSSAGGHTNRSRFASAPVEFVVREALRMRDEGLAAEAVREVMGAIAANPGATSLWHTLGLLHRALEDSQSAIDAFREAVRLAPSDPKINHALARVTMEAGLPAVELFERARQFSPNDGGLLLGRAAAQMAVGDTGQAIADLDLILTNNPAWLDGQALLSDMRWMMGLRDNFIDGYRRALAGRPGDLRLWGKMIVSLMQVERYADAIAAVSEARVKAGNDRSLDVFEAVCASELGDREAADGLFAALRPFPEVALNVRYMRHLLRTGRPAEAADIGEPLLVLPEANDVWPYMSIAWRMVGDDRWKALELRPELVGVYDLADAVDLPALAHCLRKLHVARADMAGQSVRGGTQTDGPLFARIEPEIRKLRALMENTVNAHTAGFSLDGAHPVLCHAPSSIRFAGSWSVRLSGSGKHTNHIHPRGWLSSAFYVTVPDSEDLGTPPAGWLALGSPPEELGLDLAALRHVEAKPGRLVIFPSIMWHGTVPFEHGERLTVAFDVAAPPRPSR